MTFSDFTTPTTVLPVTLVFDTGCVPHVNNYIYDKHPMKSFHEININDDSDLFYL